MYSNPSRFAPKVKKTGGEAYPQAPTMDQFYSYGAPTPQTPFVFQDGGGMNDIQKMHSSFRNHYMKKGGVTSFEESKPNRTNNFLSAIKNRAYNALQKELEQEEMNLQQGYDQAAMDMDMGYMQYGGNYGYNMDFTAANQWAKAASNKSNPFKMFDTLGVLSDAYNSVPTETYIKSIKYKPMPIAQAGLNFRDYLNFRDDLNLRDQAELPFNYGSNPASSGMMYGVNAMNPSYGNVMTEDIPGMGNPVTGLWRNTPLYSDDEYLPELKSEERPVDASIVDPIRIREEPSQLITPKDIPAGGLTSQYDPNANSRSIVEKTLDDLKTKREEAAKKDQEKNSDCPDGNCNKPKDESGSNQPAPGSQEEAQKAAAAGMTPEQYRTFLTRATVNNRRALLPGNRLRSMDFYFDTYGPGMTPITASAQGAGNQPGANQSNIARSNQVQAANMSSGRNDGGFLSRLFGHKDNYHAPQGNVTSNELSPQQQINPAGSRFDPRGYNSAYSDWRNQIFQNRRRSLGNKIDRLYAKENERYNLYGQEGSQRDYDKINRLTERYNRIGEGRIPDVADTRSPDLMWRLINDQRRKPEPFNFGNDYQRPEYKAMGGGMGYFVNGGEDDPFGTAGYSTDGYDTTEREDYAGNTIYEDYPKNPESQGNQMQKVAQTKATVKFGHYNPYEAPLLLAGMQGFADLRENSEAKKNEGIFRNKTSADQVFGEMNTFRGDYDPFGNFRPDQKVPVEESGYNFKSPYAKMGGSYKKGGEYYLTQREIDEIIAMGGQVEFLD